MSKEYDYPTEEELAYIENFDCEKNDVRELIDKLEELWWTPEWGFKRTTRQSIFSAHGLEDKEEFFLELHTGGWSGNERLLEALKKNKWFYLFYWEESKRGGHEGFRFTQLNNWNKKEVKE